MNHPTLSTIGQRIQSLLERMEMKRRDLAREAKLSLATIENALAADGLPTLRTRLAIEIALGQPLWSSAEDFTRVREQAKLIGFVPEIASLKMLRARASQLRIKGYGAATSKPELADLILRELAARKERLAALHAKMDEQL